MNQIDFKQINNNSAVDMEVQMIAMVTGASSGFGESISRQLVQAGYRLDWVQAVDQFRWSAHVELAARFSR